MSSDIYEVTVASVNNRNTALPGANSPDDPDRQENMKATSQDQQVPLVSLLHVHLQESTDSCFSELKGCWEPALCLDTVLFRGLKLKCNDSNPSYTYKKYNLSFLFPCMSKMEFYA